MIDKIRMWKATKEIAWDPQNEIHRLMLRKQKFLHCGFWCWISREKAFFEGSLLKFNQKHSLYPMGVEDAIAAFRKLSETLGFDLESFNLSYVEVPLDVSLQHPTGQYLQLFGSCRNRKQVRVNSRNLETIYQGKDECLAIYDKGLEQLERSRIKPKKQTLRVELRLSSKALYRLAKRSMKVKEVFEDWFLEYAELRIKQIYHQINKLPQSVDQNILFKIDSQSNFILALAALQVQHIGQQKFNQILETQAKFGPMRSDTVSRTRTKIAKLGKVIGDQIELSLQSELDSLLYSFDLKSGEFTKTKTPPRGIPCKEQVGPNLGKAGGKTRRQLVRTGLI